jgi:hypothetical protein
MISRVSASLPIFLFFAGAMVIVSRHALLRKSGALIEADEWQVQDDGEVEQDGQGAVLAY